MDITIVESKERLADLLYGETDRRKKERLQFLFWHKSGLATTRSQLAALLCKSLPTITAWARRYESLGLDGFLGMDYQGGGHLGSSPGRRLPRWTPAWAAPRASAALAKSRRG